MCHLSRQDLQTVFVDEVLDRVPMKLPIGTVSVPASHDFTAGTDGLRMTNRLKGDREAREQKHFGSFTSGKKRTNSWLILNCGHDCKLFGEW